MPLIAQAGRPELGPVVARAVAAPGALGSWMEALARAGEGDAVALSSFPYRYRFVIPATSSSYELETPAVFKPARFFWRRFRSGESS